MHDGQFGGRLQVEVDESCPRDVDLGDEGGGGQCGDQSLRQLARIALKRARQLHGGIAGEIAMCSLLGALEKNVGACLVRRNARQCGAYQVGKMRLDVVIHRKSGEKIKLSCQQQRKNSENGNRKAGAKNGYQALQKGRAPIIRCPARARAYFQMRCLRIVFSTHDFAVFA